MHSDLFFEKNNATSLLFLNFLGTGQFSGDEPIHSLEFVSPMRNITLSHLLAAAAGSFFVFQK
jgi:hypothetical protein